MKDLILFVGGAVTGVAVYVWYWGRTK